METFKKGINFFGGKINSLIFSKLPLKIKEIFKKGVINYAELL